MKFVKCLPEHAGIVVAALSAGDVAQLVYAGTGFNVPDALEEAVVAALANAGPEEELAALKPPYIAAANAWVATKLADGAPIGPGLFIALDDATRADLSAVATTALGADAGAIQWPESYQLGFIAMNNQRIPMPTPGEGLQLAAQVGDYYARVRQRGRTIKDSILAATTQEELDAVVIGWEV